MLIREYLSTLLSKWTYSATSRSLCDDRSFLYAHLFTQKVLLYYLKLRQKQIKDLKSVLYCTGIIALWYKPAQQNTFNFTNVLLIVIAEGRILISQIFFQVFYLRSMLDPSKIIMFMDNTLQKTWVCNTFNCSCLRLQIQDLQN